MTKILILTAANEIALNTEYIRAILTIIINHNTLVLLVIIYNNNISVSLKIKKSHQ